MTEQEILDGNRLIAEFMGVTISKKTLFKNDKDIETIVVDVYSRPSFFNDALYGAYGWASYEDLKLMLYHSSWDWLMPVVEKIENLGLYDISIIVDTCRISGDGYDKTICEEWMKIGIVYKSVVEFIKWYNKQNK